MELKNVSKYIVGPGRVFMTVLIVLIVVTVVQGFTMEAIRMCAHTRRTPAIKSELRTAEQKRIERISRSSKEFLPDGTIHLVHVQRTERGPTVEPRTEQIYDVNDKLLWEGPSDQRPYEYLSWAEQPRRYSEALTLIQIKQMQMLTPIFSRTIEIPVGSLNNTEQIWRYCPGAECFEGYNVGGDRIGYIGAAGFADSTSEAKPFGTCRFLTAWCPPDSFTPILLWQTDRRVYQINIEKRHTELLFEAGDSDIETLDLHAWRDLKAGTKDYVDTENYRPLLVCIMQDGTHHLILREPDQRLSIPGPRSSLTATRQGIFAHRVGSDAITAPAIGASPDQREEWLEQYRNKPRNMWIEFYKVSDDGSLELINRYDWTVPPIGHFTVEPLLAAQRLVSHFPPHYTIRFSVYWAANFGQGPIRGEIGAISFTPWSQCCYGFGLSTTP